MRSESSPRLINENANSCLRSEHSDGWFAMKLSLFFGILMLAAKVAAYFFTGSSTSMADAAESIVHVIAIFFAIFSLRPGAKPAAPSFLYGYERISFFSAAFEGAMIILAALLILVTAIREWTEGFELENLGMGTILILLAAAINGILGWYLVRPGRRVHSLILVANGKHVLTDSWTSFGVIVGLVLVLLTGWAPFALSPFSSP